MRLTVLFTFALALPLVAQDDRNLLVPGARVRIEAAGSTTEGRLVGRSADTMFVKLGIGMATRAIPSANVQVVEVGRRDYGRGFLIGVAGGAVAAVAVYATTDTETRTPAAAIAFAAGTVAGLLTPAYRWVRVQP